LNRTVEQTSRNRTEPDPIRPLAPQEFEQIRQLAYRTFGLNLRSGKEELVSARLRKLVAKGGFRTYQEYYRHVLQDPTGRSLESMIDALTTNYTSFLRGPDHFDFLRQHVLPQLGDRNPIEIWCAACSTGEEVWTLACLCNDAFPTRKIQITATDISTKALRFAAEGFYPPERCESLPAEWRARYFPVEKGPPAGLRVSPKLRSQVIFRRLNLVEEFSWPKPFPLIFCRNVMIYFDRDTQARLVKRLEEALEGGGYLFVGHAESLARMEHSLQYIRPAIYRKPRTVEKAWSKSS
jgi:chemotaxis protein methyltransferase CheR